MPQSLRGIKHYYIPLPLIGVAGIVVCGEDRDRGGLLPRRSQTRTGFPASPLDRPWPRTETRSFAPTAQMLRKTYERAGDTGCRFLCQPNGDPRTAAGSSSREPNEACGGCRPHRWNPKPLRGRWGSLVGHRLDQLKSRRRRAATRKLRRKPTSSSANPRADPPVWRNAQSTFPRIGARVPHRLKGMRLHKQASVSDHARHQPRSVLGV